MKSAEIREAFLNYFEQQGHQRVPSSSLVPGNDPTLLFTNAGMVQFKDVFLGQESRSFRRACSAQRCVRAGGKHNDLENVGFTARHHTFFEMLGNFSFGDYFKQEAIRFAWQFLTEVLKLPAGKLWITVHISDDEAERIWKQDIGIDPARFSKLDEDNFWQMGDTGPCGPSSEIFYDHGPGIAGGPPGSPDDDGDRYIEIWNLVFMQFSRGADGQLSPLPNPSIDTGMGLERVAAVMQGVHDNYDIDLFRHLLDAAATLIGVQDRSQQSLRVIVDHIRSCAFLALDGVLPGNEGRGYVLRRIIRRAVRHGNKLGAPEGFFHQLVAPLAEVMGEAYPELVHQRAMVEKVLRNEEEQFARTLDKGMNILDEALADLADKVVPGEVIFKLYDTYGFPVDLTNDIARERGLGMDMAGYELAMADQRKRSQDAGSFRVDYSDSLDIEGQTEFTGYEGTRERGRISAIIVDGEQVDSLAAGQQAAIVLDSTAFYAESGGQVGDRGELLGTDSRFRVDDTRKSQDNFLHYGLLESGSLKVGDELSGQVDETRRVATARNHSATHLLHASLREILGEHVTQKGSLVDSEHLRFDFSHGEALTKAQLKAIEARVNEQILANTPVDVELSDIDSAIKKGALALFGEKYGEQVRVLTMGQAGFSVELCGGTHVSRTGDIGLMRIVSESGIAAGIRRIDAVTGFAALAQVDSEQAQLQQIAALVKSSGEQVVSKVEQLAESHKKLEKEVDRLKGRLASSAGSDLAANAREIGGIKVLAAQLDGVDRKSLMSTMDQLKNKLGSAVILLASIEGDSIALAAGVTPDLLDRFKAGELMKTAAAAVGGKGGGRADMAQGGGSDVAALPAALEAVYSWVEAAG